MIGAVAVRLLFVFLHPIDSDEPQHLHVAWAWSRALVQYRDVFDNHFPLLHLLFAPLMPFVPESSAVFLLMRLLIAPIAIGCAWILYCLGRDLIGTRGAAIAALTFSVMPPWLPKSVEFRNDTLWIFFWLAALALIAARRRPAYAAAGIAVALCLLTSVKAVPLLLAHLLALVSQRQAVSPKVALRVACGAAIPLAAIAVFMVANGALDEMLYATLFFNAAVPVDAGRRIVGAAAFAIIAPALALRRPRALSEHPFALHLTLFALWYCVLLLCFWPILTPRDFLPLVPLAALVIGASRIVRAAPAAMLIAATLASVWYARLWRPADVSRQRFVDAAARLTARDEYVFDMKGDAVFRRRPVYPIYDAVGRALTSNGTIPDRGPEQIAARGWCVAMEDSERIPPRTRAFLNEHFIDAGPLRVCGSIARAGMFTIAVPQTYAVLARDSSAVAIDGVPYRGPRFFAAGRHTLTTTRRQRVTVIWWRAVACGRCGARLRRASGEGKGAPEARTTPTHQPPHHTLGPFGKPDAACMRSHTLSVAVRTTSCG